MHSLQIAAYVPPTAFSSLLSEVSDEFLIPVEVVWPSPHWAAGDLLSSRKPQQERQVFLGFDNANSLMAELPPSVLY